MTGELLVFGRTEYVEPLTELTAAPAGEDVLATRPGPWVELVVFPRTAVHWIIRDGVEVESEHALRAR